MLVTTTPAAFNDCQKGSDLYAAQKWPEALAAFQEAWALQKTYDIAANLGHTEVKLERWRDAAEHLSFAVKNWPVVGKPEPRELAKQRLSEARAKVAAVTVEVNVVGAEVLVDGKLVGKAPLEGEVFVDPGAHRVEGRMAGYKGDAVGVQGTAGGTHAVKVVLAREDVEVPSSGGWKTGVIIGGAAASVVGLGLGVGFTLAANGKASELVTLRDELQQMTPSGALICEPLTPANSARCADLEAASRKVDTFDGVALAGFIGGAALAAGTAAFVVWTRLSSQKVKPPSALVIPTLNASSAGATLTGSF
jgi:hypothetical protein